MFRAARMKRVLVVLPRGRLDAAIEAVADLGVLHLLDLSEREEWSWGTRPYDVEAARRECTEILRRIVALIRFFDPPPLPGAADAGAPDPQALEARVADWHAEMEEIRDERARLRGTLEELSRAADALATLTSTGVDPERLRQMQLLHPACGWIEAADLERLDESLVRVSHRLVVGGARGSRRLLFAFALPRDRETLERALRGVGFQRLELAPRVAAGAVEARLEDTRARLATLEERFERRRRELAAPLARARSEVERELLLVEARGFASRSESVVFLAGWLPEGRLEAVGAAVERATGGRCHLHATDPLSIDSVRAGSEPVPILFRNPVLVRPFERLTAGYGAPRWREIDPTPLVAVAFWSMFGLMFGDVGHGAVLAGGGWWIFRRMAPYRDFGVILMECGVASMAFGFAYGSVFGFEDLLPALWFRPMDDVARLLAIGAGFGLVMVGLSFGLGVLNAALRRDWSGALFGAHGLVAAFAYWTAAALGLRWLATGDVGVSIGLAAAFLALPLAFLWGRGVAAEWGRGAAPGSRSPVAAALAGSVELLDFVIRGLANTVSFVRLAAFAVSHAGVLLAVFALAEMLSASRLGMVWGALVLVAGNALVIALEGLIVSIQTVRLVYYEFFSRFHEGTGMAYRPLRLRTQGGEEEAK